MNDQPKHRKEEPLKCDTECPHLNAHDKERFNGIPDKYHLMECYRYDEYLHDYKRVKECLYGFPPKNKPNEKGETIWINL